MQMGLRVGGRGGQRAWHPVPRGDEQMSRDRTDLNVAGHRRRLAPRPHWHGRLRKAKVTDHRERIRSRGGLLHRGTGTRTMPPDRTLLLYWVDAGRGGFCAPTPCCRTRRQERTP